MKFSFACIAALVFTFFAEFQNFYVIKTCLCRAVFMYTRLRLLTHTHTHTHTQTHTHTHTHTGR